MDKARFLKNIGKRLRELRGDRTQKSICVALSKILGEARTKESYQHYEAGRRLVPSDVLWGLSEIYGVSSDWILIGKKPAAGKKTVNMPNRIYGEVLSLSEQVQSLPKKERDAIKVILDAMRK